MEAQQDGVPGGAPRARPATRRDVARLAGVSTAVVSHVVNGGPKTVSEATTRRVLEAVEALGYRPNRTARALSMGSTRTLGLLVPDATNPFYAEYTAALREAAATLGYALLSSAGGQGPDADLRTLVDLCDRQIDGLILTRAAGAGRLDALERRVAPPPVVVIDTITPVPGHASVGPEAAAGMAAAVEHLLQVHGHAAVALVVGSVEAAEDGRETGWRGAHERRGRAPGPLVRAGFSRAGGFLAGTEVLAGPDRPAAVVLSSDLQATGFLRAADELGLRVPDDVAVVSFDGTEEVQYATPPMTTVRQPTAAMAAAAVEALVDRRPPDHRTFPMDLVVRRSCGCRPGSFSVR